MLVAPTPQEPLLLYLAATNEVVSAALVAQREVDKEAVATVMLADGKQEIPPVGPGAGKARPRQSLTPSGQVPYNQMKWRGGRR